MSAPFKHSSTHITEKKPLPPITEDQVREFLSFWATFTTDEMARMRTEWNLMSAIDPDKADRGQLYQRWRHFAAYCDIRDRMKPGSTFGRMNKTILDRGSFLT